MRIAQINMMHVGSTGRIMFDLAENAVAAGHDVHCFSPRYYRKKEKGEFHLISGHSFFGWRFENMLHVRLAQVTGFHGCFSFFGTRQLLRLLDEFKPEVIHLHNLHNWTINLPMMFRYIKRRNVRVVWTLHDCWSFTGQCPHFAAEKCEKWKNGCHHCAQIREYPQCFVDNTKNMYRLKRRWFTGVSRMTIVTPSHWLAGLVRESYLGDYPIEVIHNGIDLSVFKPTPGDFRTRNNLHDMKIVLGVAFGWGYKKGLDVFIELARRLGDEYKIVLVGTDEKVDRQLPESILSIHRTEDSRELAEIYTAADLFVNPTREDTFPTVNMEALACGTPVAAFHTGGSPEAFDDTCGISVPCGDVDALETVIRRVLCEQTFSREACLRYARNFDKHVLNDEYVRLYGASPVSHAKGVV